MAGGDAVHCADLGVDVLDVVACGLGRDAELLADLARGEAARNEAENFDLARREAGGSLAPLADPVARGAEDGLDRVAVELAAPDLGTEQARGFVERARRTVGARLAHRLV